MEIIGLDIGTVDISTTNTITTFLLYIYTILNYVRNLIQFNSNNSTNKMQQFPKFIT